MLDKPVFSAIMTTPLKIYGGRGDLMLTQQFLDERILHLYNRKKAIEDSLRNYGSSMPEEHRDYKSDILLPSIEEAIHKIVTGDQSYGICLECREEISQKRLGIFPESTLCVQCQEAIEKSDQRRSEHELHGARFMEDMGGRS